MEAFFSESEARQQLADVNSAMANIFCKPVRSVRFVFLSYIASGKRNTTALGQCVRMAEGDEIQIVVRAGWQNTAIHELVHVYNPNTSEKRIRQITEDVIRYLKSRYGSGRTQV